MMDMIDEIRKKMDEEAMEGDKPPKGGMVLIISTGKKPKSKDEKESSDES